MPRPTAYLSASLLLLPIPALAAPGWSCHTGADGNWTCAPKSDAAASGATPVPVQAPTQVPTTQAPPARALPTQSLPTAAPTTPAPARPAPIAPPPAAPVVAAPLRKEPEPQPAPQTVNSSSAPAQTESVAPKPAATAKPVATEESTAPAAAAANTATYSPITANTWDWQPYSDAVCCRPDSVCDGVYIEPPFNWQDADKSPKQVPVRADAAHSEWVGDVVKMDGGVTVTQGHLKLTADRAELERSTNRAHLYGNVIVHQPGTRITGTSADMTTTNSFGNVIDATMLDYTTGARVTANKLSRRKENVIELDQAVFTRCPPDSEDWKLDSRHVRLDRESGRGEAGHTVIRVADVPVFYTPYINFPLDDRRQSGFLWPGIATSSGGFDISAPYYLNLAPNLDATIAPRAITDRGTMVETELRYLNSFSNWQLNGSKLSNDQKTDEDRWFMSAKESGHLNSYFSTAIDYTRVSDANYLHDFSITSLNIKRQVSLNQSAALNLNYENWFSGIQVQQYQTVDPLINEPYRQKPRFIIGRNAEGTNFALDYSLLGEFTDFDHDEANELTRGGPWVTGNRLYLEPGVSFPMRWTSSYFTPELRLRNVSYDLSWPDSQSDRSNHMSTTVPETILDAGVFFDREVAFGESSFQQTLEPRLYYLYSPFQKQLDHPLFDTSALTFDYHQLFQPRRFIGNDRLEDFNQASAGMTSRLIEDSSGRELGHASIGQIFYFADRKVNTLPTESEDSQANSAIAAQLAAQPLESLWTTTNALWDADQNRIQQGNFYLHYEPKDRAIYNLGYRYNESNPEVSTLTNGIRQADASMALPISQSWRLFMRVNYDLDLHSSLEDLVGLEYEDCCWLTRIVYQRAVFGQNFENNTLAQPETSQRESAILIEFQLKGLGGLGRKVDTLLKESIWGYK
ncbi:MAG TPA: LPS assembly protein LptD [Spongiibacteraceae bacterium]|nr:LPS assembly protein LptD [Spongiibacteraceae bacterium]